MGGVSSSCVVSSVYHGETQRAGRCLVSSESDLGLRVDSEAGSVSGTAQEVAGFHRPVRHLSKSPLFSIFFSLPRSECSGNGCSSELEWVADVYLSSLVSNSSGAEEAPVVLWGPYWPQRPWFPDLLHLVVDGPVALPQSRDLLSQPHFHRFHLGVSKLSLHAWRLASDLPVPGVSPSV